MWTGLPGPSNGWASAAVRRTRPSDHSSTADEPITDSLGTP
jgi:hypothetical protein